MTKDQFIKGYQQRSNFTDQQMTEFLKNKTVVICNCGCESCQGYAIEQTHEQIMKDAHMFIRLQQLN